MDSPDRAGGNPLTRSGGTPDSTKARWRRVFAAADAALELPYGERAAFVEQCVAEDPALGRELRSLLESGEAASPLDGAATALAAPLAHELQRLATVDSPGRFGPYRILREIGRGGMGAVYLAMRADAQYQKQVALKVLSSWSAGDDVRVRRFLDERQILAALDHPDIAGLFDGGITAEGLPWFAMEFVEGVQIDRYCDSHACTTEERLELFCRVCTAVQYAHRNLVVHRDLKPANILVTDDGRVKLLDFGIAKLLAGDRAAPELTMTGDRLLTPLYASPEQMRGESISTVSDVYSLGVLLNVLLTGLSPYMASSREFHHVARAVIEQEPRRASLTVESPAGALNEGVSAEQIAAARATTPAKLKRRLQGDLDAILLKAMAKEPGRRYATVEQLETDVRRHLSGLPVVAQPESRLYHARKFVARHRGGVAAAAGIVTLVLTFAGVATVQAARIRAQADRIALERDRVTAVNAFLTQAVRNSAPARPDRGVTARDILDSASARISHGMPGSPGLRGELMFAMAETYRRLDLPDRALALAESSLAIRRAARPRSDAALAESHHLLGEIFLAQNRLAPARQAFDDALALRRRASGARHGDVARTLVGLASVLRAEGTLVEAEARAREALALHGARRGDTRGDVAEASTVLGRILIDRGDHVGAARQFRHTLRLVRESHPEEHREVARAVFDLGGALKIAGNHADADSLIRYANALHQRLLTTLMLGGMSGQDSGDDARASALVGAAVSRVFHERAAPGVAGPAAADDSRIVFSSDRDGRDPSGDLGNQEIYIMKPDGSEQRRLTHNEGVDNGAVFSGDGRTIAFASVRNGERDIYVMKSDGTGQRRVTNFGSLQMGGNQPALSRDGRRIAFRRGSPADIYVINVDGTGLVNVTNHPAADAAPAWSPDGRLLAFASNRDERPGIYVMNADGTDVRFVARNHAQQPSLAWSPDGRRFAFVSERDGDREIYMMNADGSGIVRLTTNPSEDTRPSWSPDGRQIVFSRVVLGHAQVYVMNADGSNVRRLTAMSTTVYNGFPDWGRAAP